MRSGSEPAEAFEVRDKEAARVPAAQLALEMMHDIRNPLEALSNLLYVCLEKADEPESVKHYVRLAQEQAASLNVIAENVLGFARSSRAPRPTCLVALLEAALRIHQTRIEARAIRLLKDLPEGLVAEVHAGEILQVISNVMANALDALSIGGTLSVRLHNRGEEAQFLISDNGHGIPKELLNHVFEPLFTTREELGTGLGLALSQRIVLRHGGKICIRSCVRPGRTGTTFKILLPVRA